MYFIVYIFSRFSTLGRRYFCLLFGLRFVCWERGICYNFEFGVSRDGRVFVGGLEIGFFFCFGFVVSGLYGFG